LDQAAKKGIPGALDELGHPGEFRKPSTSVQCFDGLGISKQCEEVEVVVKGFHIKPGHKITMQRLHVTGGDGLSQWEK
jgi:hypothetical protein